MTRLTSDSTPPVAGPLLSRFGARLKATHLSDCDGRGDRHWLPGRGDIHWPTIAALLASSRRIGAVGWEFLADGTRAASLAEFPKQAMESIRRAMPSLFET